MTETSSEIKNEHQEKPIRDKTESARSMTTYLFLAVVVVWVYSLWADRTTPMTDQGRVNGQVIQLSPQVSGPITQVHISDNAQVKQGQLLVTIDKKPFELDVKAARLELQQAAQTFNADSAAINVAKANQVAAQVKVDNTRLHVERNKALLRRGIISQASMDDSTADLESAEANLAQATAALEKAEQEFGPRGESNPEIQAVLNKLEQALLNLAYTDVYAPADGVITNMNLAVGNYATTGQPLMTHVNNIHFWLTAMVRENSLAYLEPGTPVKVVFDSYPGKIFTGSVATVGWGSSGNGSLQVDGANGLLNSPSDSPKSQRFPVNINLDELPDNVNLRYNGRAMVSFYPGKSSFGERLLDLWTWAWSYLTYVS